ncbi:MAG: YciI family protein [Nitrospirota bacterium]
MQYMLMCCFEEKAWEKLSGAQRDEIMKKYGEVIQGLIKSGHLRGGGRLHATASATTVRMKSGAPVFTDGPLAETKEQFGGYHLVECKDLDEAMSIAARIPTLPVGGAIEVRPVAMTEC